MNLADAPDVMKVRDVAEVLDVNPKSVYSAIARGEIKALRLGRTIRVSKRALETFLGIETNGARANPRRLEHG